MANRGKHDYDPVRQGLEGEEADAPIQMRSVRVTRNFTKDRTRVHRAGPVVLAGRAAYVGVTHVPMLGFGGPVQASTPKRRERSVGRALQPCGRAPF